MSAIKDKTRELIESLSDEDVEILHKVAERLSELEATRELLIDREMMASIQQGLKEIAQGETVPLEELRKGVSTFSL